MSTGMVTAAAVPIAFASKVKTTTTTAAAHRIRRIHATT